MTQVAVTGGAGFIGSNLVSRLTTMGHKVVVVDDLSTGLITNLDKQNCEFHHLSITDFSKLENAISSCEVVFHLAARGSVPRSIKNPRATHDVNVTGTLNIMEIARSSGAHVIFSSSSSVYGRNLHLPKDEAMWLGPLTPYAASKLAAEGYVEAYGSAYGVPVSILRFFNVFGPNQRPDHEYAAVLPKWIWLALHNQPINVFGDGNTSRDFTYIETVLDVAISAMTEKIFTSGVVNLAYGNKISLNDVVSLLKKNFPDLKVQQMPPRSGDVRESQNNPSLVKELFPQVNPKPFEQAFQETLDWLRNFGDSVANGPETND